MSKADDVVARWQENPFYVLGLSTEATRADVERVGTKLLGMLELGLASAKTYATPLGPAERTPDRVRAAMAELRDPDRRLVHELWARLPAESEDANAGAKSEVAAAEPGWGDAMSALGWRAP